MKILHLWLAAGFVYCLPVFSQKVALDFDGANDQVSVPNASSLLSGTPMSMTFWVYPTNSSPSYPNFDGMAGFRNDITADFYILHLSSTTVEARFRNSSGSNYNIVGTAAVNTWQHYALVYNGTTLTLYRNGTVNGSVSASGSFASSSETLYLGNLVYSSTNFYLDGKLDDFTFWNKALSASEVSCIYNYGVDTSMSGLSLYYSCDQGNPGGNNSGLTTLYDAMGNINGTLSGFSLSGSSSNYVNGYNTHNYLTANICEGDSIQFNTKYISQAGSYRAYFQLPSGCDSLVQLQVKVHQADTTKKNYRICKGDSVAFSGSYVKLEGSYSQTFNSRYGCDSTSIVNVDVDTVEIGINKGGKVLYSLAQNATYQWYNCDGDSIIPGQTNQTFSFSQHASYAVIVTQNGCTDTSDCLYTALGIGNYKNYPVVVSPNPATDYISVSGIDGRVNVVIYDITLRPILQSSLSETETLDVSKLSRGSYILRMFSPGFDRSVRIFLK